MAPQSDSDDRGTSPVMTSEARHVARAETSGDEPERARAGLRELEGAAVVRRRRLPPPTPASVYELTGWARELEPLVRSLSAWAVRSPSFPRRHGLRRPRPQRRAVEGRDLAEALRAGEWGIEGDRQAVARFLELFPSRGRR